MYIITREGLGQGEGATSWSRSFNPPAVTIPRPSTFARVEYEVKQILANPAAARRWRQAGNLLADDLYITHLQGTTIVSGQPRPSTARTSATCLFWTWPGAPGSAFRCSTLAPPPYRAIAILGRIHSRHMRRAPYVMEIERCAERMAPMGLGSDADCRRADQRQYRSWG